MPGSLRSCCAASGRGRPDMAKPPRLGMGLSALLGDSPAATTPRSLPVGAMEPGPFQPRLGMAETALADLAASIREHGVLQPILVRPKPGLPGSFEIIGGERRWRAAQLAQLHEVPVVVRDLDDRAALAAALVENLQREDLNALEEARGYRRLMDEFGLSQDALGQAVGKSRSHVANTVRLLALPEKVQGFLSRGVLTAGHARALLTSEDPAKLAEQVAARGLSVRQTEALVASGERSKLRRASADADTRALERQITARLGLRVRIAHRGKAGTLSIAYRDLEQLDGLIRLLNGG
jgi:ParB family transcriptional regulator, chromosome partitioning protein